MWKETLPFSGLGDVGTVAKENTEHASDMEEKQFLALFCFLKIHAVAVTDYVKPGAWNNE